MDFYFDSNIKKDNLEYKSLSSLYLTKDKKMGNREKAEWAMGKAMSTGKVDVAFVRNEDEVITQAKDWSDRQEKKESERDTLVERRVFPSWSLRVPHNF